MGRVRITGQDYYNTDGNGMILVVEREDGWYAEAATDSGSYVGLPAEEAAIAGAPWRPSPNDVIEAWYQTFHDGGQLIRPNRRP